MNLTTMSLLLALVAAEATSMPGRCPLLASMPRRATMLSRRLQVRGGDASETTKPVLVIGSVNADTIIEVDRLPRSGETITSRNADTGRVFCGGKGANQAVAASKIGLPGVRVRFAGCFGSDVHAPMLRRTMEAAAVTSPRVTGAKTNCRSSTISRR